MSDEGYCPICGADTRRHGLRAHRCKQRTLDAIDAAMQRDPDTEEPPAKPFSARLHDGFKMLNEGNQ